MRQAQHFPYHDLLASVRSQLNELAEQVERLRSAAESGANTQNTDVADSTIGYPPVSTASNHASSQQQFNPGFRLQLPRPGTNNDLACLDSNIEQAGSTYQNSDVSHSFPTDNAQSIDDVSLDTEQISYLFRKYVVSPLLSLC